MTNEKATSLNSYLAALAPAITPKLGPYSRLLAPLTAPAKESDLDYIGQHIAELRQEIDRLRAERDELSPYKTKFEATPGLADLADAISQLRRAAPLAFRVDVRDLAGRIVRQAIQQCYDRTAAINKAISEAIGLPRQPFESSCLINNKSMTERYMEG